MRRGVGSNQTNPGTKTRESVNFLFFFRRDDEGWATAKTSHRRYRICNMSLFSAPIAPHTCTHDNHDALTQAKGWQDVVEELVIY
jgi:hypothetical protein